MTESVPSKPGKVYLVGAGPGDPELITLRGMRCLEWADLVLYDYLVNPRTLRHAPARAELVCLGRHGRGRLLSQDEINARMVVAAKAGQQVVRLKAGDPTIFARVSEELEALEAAGIAYEIVPGVTAALAAGSYAGIPLTQRDASSAVAFITGQESSKQTGDVIDYGALAKFPGTLVFYMGVTTAKVWSQALIAAGKPADTPAAIVRRISWPDQHSETTTLEALPEALAQHRLRPPVIVIVGEVAAAERWRPWFAERPLFGKRVLVTRPEHQADELADLLAAAGADVLFQPAIDLLEPHDWATVDAALGRLHDFQWLVFSSANGVRALLGRLLHVGGDMRSLGATKLAAIGPGTAAELARHGLRADVVPAAFDAEALADALVPMAAGQRVLLARASRGREVHADRLRAANCQVEQVVVYRSVDVKAPEPAILEDLAAGRINWITVTSSAIGRSLVALFGEGLHNTQLASISPLTSRVLSAAGHPPRAEASEATMTGVVAAILAAERGQDSAIG
ncbi:MAG: uroporphyrinogen-III C-methyltransferase [Planctomycetia bacterium]|nr:uroporphyrinogen-III C-methyltransferase [Planctomycetia bacterium]